MLKRLDYGSSEKIIDSLREKMNNDSVTNFKDERNEGTSKHFERNSFSVDETWSKEKNKTILDAYDQLAKTTNKNEHTWERE